MELDSAQENHVVHPEVRAYIYSLVTAVRHYPFVEILAFRSPVNDLCIFSSLVVLASVRLANMFWETMRWRSCAISENG